MVAQWVEAGMMEVMRILSRKNCLLQLLGVLSSDSVLLSALSGIVSTAKSHVTQGHTLSWAALTQRLTVAGV